MELLTPTLRAALRANADASHYQRAHDPAPVVKLFAPVGAAMWLATELDADGVTLFGLADLGFGCPELGYFSLAEIAALRLPFGLSVERDLHFASDHPLSAWAKPLKVPAMRSIVGMAAKGDAARHAGSIIGAVRHLAYLPARAAPGPSPTSDCDPLPPPDPGGG